MCVIIDLYAHAKVKQTFSSNFSRDFTQFLMLFIAQQEILDYPGVLF